MKYQLVATDYVSTGGNCMETICDVWLTEERRIAHVYIGDRLSTLVLKEFSRQDVVADDYESTVNIVDFSWNADTDNPYFELHRQCVAAHAANSYKYDGRYSELHYDWLLPEFQKQITSRQRAIVEDLGNGTFATDGDCVYLPSDDGLQLVILSMTDALEIDVEQLAASYTIKAFKPLSLEEALSKAHTLIEVIDTEKLSDTDREQVQILEHILSYWK